MLRRVEIQGFRGFRSFVAELDRTTLVLGPNSSGKTSMLQAVRLACDACELALELPTAAPRTRAGGVIEVCSAKTTVVPDPSRLVPLAEFRQMFVDGDVSDGTELSVRLDFEPHDPVEALAVRLVYSRNAQLKLEVLVSSFAATAQVAHTKPKSPGRPAKLRDVLESVRPIAYFVPAFYGVTRTEEYRTLPVVSRMLGGGDQSHIVRNLVARLSGEALDRMNTFLRLSIGASIAERTSGSDAERRAELVVTYRDRNGELELSSAGAGLVALVALYAAMERARLERAATASGRAVLFLLDEPEAHLHPRLAADVAEAIVRTAADFDVQLALATHSVEVTNRLALRPATAVLLVDRQRSAALSLGSEAELIAALDGFCDLTPFASLNFLSSRRVLFVEGPTDRRVLEACARVLYQTDEARFARFQSATVVELDGVGNVSMKGVLEKLLAPKVFARIDPKRPVRVAIALDRDWIREPKPVATGTPHAHLHTVETVWSRHSLESLFLEPAVLTAWLAPYLDDPPPRELIALALAAADKDDALVDAAVEGRCAFYGRIDRDKKFLQAAEVRRLALADVRGAPAVFQRGKNRAAFVLEHVRAALDAAQRQRLRGTLVDLIEGADRARVPAVEAVPAEVRAFLDAVTHVATPPAPRRR